jgi:putative lipoic acid-binding regulatory protein
MDTPKKATLEDLMTFPAELVLRVMGEQSESLVDRCTAAATQALGRAPLHVGVQPSSKGNFLAVRLRVRVETADEVRAASAGLKAVEGVRLVL